jgi:hypothetical protein
MARGEAMKKEKEAPVKMSKPWIDIESDDDLGEEDQYLLTNPKGYSIPLIERVGRQAMMGGYSNILAIKLLDLVLEEVEKGTIYADS